MTMRDDHKRIFQTRRTFLLENLWIDTGVNVLDILYRDNIITSDDLEKINVSYAGNYFGNVLLFDLLFIDSITLKQDIFQTRQSLEYIGFAEL